MLPISTTAVVDAQPASTGSASTLSTPTLIVDLANLVANYRRIRAELSTRSEAAAVVKADCFGLGLGPVVEALSGAGCRTFFVARLDEALAVRALVPEARVVVFDGVLPGQEADLVAHDIVPVVNTLGQLDRWQRWVERQRQPLATALHVDTGMTRLGLDRDEWSRLSTDPHLLEGLRLELVLSHLASADEADTEQNELQLKRFLAVRRSLPDVPASLANSAGVFLGPDYHFDLVRPGFALYGGHPQPERLVANPMLPVVTLEAPIVQIRRAEPGDTVGYGASHRVDRASVIATVGLGYADGFLRSASNRSSVVIAGASAPIVGRVSMDLITVDVTDLEPSTLYEGAPVEVIGPSRTVDAVAADAGTIGYEVLTSLGHRFARRYRPATPEPG